MAIVFQNDQGWILCHKTFLNGIYEKCIGVDSRDVKLKVKDVFFRINTPILMDSEVLKYAMRSKQNYFSKDEKKCKKKKKILMKEETYHNEVVTSIKSAKKVLLDNAFSLGHLKDNVVTTEEWFENNYAAREAAKEVFGAKNVSPESLNFILYENKNVFPVIMELCKEDYVVPPLSTFLLSDIKKIDVLIGNIYDAIVIDPPWENKSARRKKEYSTIKCTDLLQLPIPKLTKLGSLVIVWATNNETQINFIKEKLFPAWGLHHCADWHWVKVTLRGAFVYSIDSLQKKPYENIIIGCVGPAADRTTFPCLEPNKVIVSVPSSIHSHKPPLSDVLKPYLPNDAKCLELFARYLLPGWTSCGNEVLRLQNLKMFEHIEEDKIATIDKTSLSINIS